MNPLTLASAALLAGGVSLGTVSPVLAFGPHNILAQHLKFERDRQRAVYAQGIFRSRTFQHLEDHKT